jgi:hypothetical protein
MAAPKVTLFKLDELCPDPRNARIHDEANVRLLVGLIERFGWTNPFLVDVQADKLIIAGHGRRFAAKEIYDAGGKIYLAPGRDHGGAALPAGTVPGLDCSGWSAEERQAYNIADNRSAETSAWDLPALQEQLASLAEGGFEFADLGFEAGDLDAMLAHLADDAGGSGGGPATPPDQFPEFGDDIQTEHQCPKCAYKWSGKSS